MSIVQYRTYGKKTATANTAIVQLVSPIPTMHSVIQAVSYTAGATAHDLVIMQPFNYTVFSADAAAGQAVVNIEYDPGDFNGTRADGSPKFRYLTGGSASPQTADNAIAGSDYVVYELADGTYVVDTVSSVSSLAITLTTNLPTGGVKTGARMWFYGVAANTNPVTGAAHPLVTMASGATTLYPNQVNGFVGATNAPGDPLILYSANATNAGTLNYASVTYHK